MKKSFTLLFFAVCLSTAVFAQDGGRYRQNNQYNNDRNSSYGYGGDHNGYNNDRQWRDRRDDDHYRDQRFDGDHRDGWDRDDRRFRRDDRDRDHYREMRQYSDGYLLPLGFLQVIIGHRDRH